MRSIHEIISATKQTFFGERFSAPNPTDSAHFHYFYHVPPVCQPVTHQRGRIWVARLVRLILVLNGFVVPGFVFAS